MLCSQMTSSKQHAQRDDMQKCHIKRKHHAVAAAKKLTNIERN